MVATSVAIAAAAIRPAFAGSIVAAPARAWAGIAAGVLTARQTIAVAAMARGFALHRRHRRLGRTRRLGAWAVSPTALAATRFVAGDRRRPAFEAAPGLAMVAFAATPAPTDIVA